MWGLPGQSVAEALQDLRQAIQLQPQHISWYQLTIEPKTEFAGRPPILPVDRVLQEIEQAGLALLAEAGFQRYEVSAFARTGYQCQHNLVYWSFGDYMGIGAGAHGKITQGPKIYRTQRPSQPRLYQQDSQTTKLTEIPQTQRTIEFMMNALRLLDGVTQQSFAERTQLPWQSVSQVWQELVDLELVRHDRCATTALGLRYLDSVLERFLEA
jgi:oxygen-independent coproporphyrinogen-3 oxidase